MTEDAPVVGVLTTAETPAREQLEGAVEAAGAVPRLLDPTATLPGDLVAVVANRAPALRSIAHRSPAVPVLPVDVDCGLPSVPRSELQPAIEAVLAERATIQDAPLLEVAVDGEVQATVFRELTMITAEPARISEFEIVHERAGSIDTVRADGVIVATPAGSFTYAAAGEGPLLEPGTGLAIVPVAPFRTDRDRWVVPNDRVTVRVQRDEAAVTVEADGAILTAVGRDAEVSLTPAGKLGVLVVDESSRDPR